MTSYSSDCLKIISYNCRGWKSSSDYVKSLLQSCDICLIQEHWLFRENLDSLLISNDFRSVGVSGMDSSQLLSGRPFGGCCILYRKALSTAVRRIFSHSKRFCAISITFNSTSVKSSFVVLLVCVYLPTDYYNTTSQLAFSESLCELDGLLSAEHFDSIIIAGDFNVDFTRSGPNCSNLYALMSSNNLVSVDQMYTINYTYHKDDISCFSSPDHILTSSNYSHLIDDVFAHDSAENFSDHLSLHFTFKFAGMLSIPSSVCSPRTAVNCHSPTNPSQSINWYKVTPNDISSFCDNIVTTLPEFPSEIFNCCDTDCTSHQSMLNSYCEQLFNSISTAADLCLSKHRGSGHTTRSLSGWNNGAHFLKQSANFWHKVWNECGCPTSGVLFQIKKASKSRFKYEVRRLRRRQCHIRRENLADALVHSHPQEFWRQVKKITKSSKGVCSSSLSNTVDGSCDHGEIANIFSCNIKSILNSSPDQQSRSNLHNQMNKSISPSDLSSMLITQETVLDAISQLKPGKNDGSDFMSNHFIHAKEVLSDPLSKLFTAMLRHGVIPDSLRDCILVPIPKPGKNLSSSDSYRPIALAPTLSKVFEWCLLFNFQSCFVTSPLQFGFKPGFSADLCTGLLKNII